MKAGMQLRWYQTEAKAAVYKHLEEKPGSNPCIVLPTGAGKSPLLAAICADVVGWGGRALVLAHVKELLQQSADKLQKFLPAEMVGVYSAGLNSRDTDHPVVVAGIQSVFKRAGELGPFACIIIDECHLINSNNDTGMYKTFLDSARIVNPRVRIVGLTATPYRLDSGHICGPENILNEIAYEVGVKELIVQGYLCPIRTRAGREHADLSGVHTRGGEFIESEMEERMDAIVGAACEEVVDLTRDRNAVLVFASGVKHGRHIQARLAELTGLDIGFLHGETPSGERAGLLARFRGDKGGLFRAPLKYLVNVNVLTTGFDAPNVDCVVLLRATLSPGLYYQMCGRGLRIHPDKADCIVLDYGENAVRHGPIDAIRIKDKSAGGDGEAPAKECPECHAVVFAGVAKCPACGYEFPKPDLKHTTKAGRAGVISGEGVAVEYVVKQTAYDVHYKKDNPDAPTTMRVDYDTGGFTRDAIKSEWLHFNRTGWLRQLAEQWWRLRSDLPPPETTEDAVRLARAGILRKVKGITWSHPAGEKYGKIIGHDFDGEKLTAKQVDELLGEFDRAERAKQEETGFPEPVTAGGGDWFDEIGLKADDIPF